MRNFDYLTIEPSVHRDGEFAVYGHDTYPRSSVLAGRHRRTFLDSFESPEAAAEAYPEADAIEWSSRAPDHDDPLGPNPASWFDPAAAGERWDDDY